MAKKRKNKRSASTAPAKSTAPTSPARAADAGSSAPATLTTDAPESTRAVAVVSGGSADAGLGASITAETAVASMTAKVAVPAPPPASVALDETEDDFGPRSLVPSFGLDAEDFSDVAPIGPTESPSPGRDEDPPASTPRVAATASPEELRAQIDELEARLDSLIEKSSAHPSAPPSVDAPPPSSPAIRLEAPANVADPAMSERLERRAEETARELTSTKFYVRQWGRLGMRRREEEVDDFGQDPAYESRLRPLLDFLYGSYFRVQTEGANNIPGEGRCLIVANHSGGPLPYDGLMLRAAVRREHAQHRELRWLSEDFIHYLPFIGAMMNRLGAVRACQENAERLLAQERLVAVFPEGAKGIGKLYKDRYKLQRFGRGGFIRLALRTQTTIVPSAIIGAEEANPMLYRIEYMTKALGMPYFPITPTFPALGPLGLLPAPTKWRIIFGEPISLGGYGPDAVDDEILVGKLAEQVRQTIQAMVQRALEARQSVWFG